MLILGCFLFLLINLFIQLFYLFICIIQIHIKVFGIIFKMQLQLRSILVRFFNDLIICISQFLQLGHQILILYLKQLHFLLILYFFRGNFLSNLILSSRAFRYKLLYFIFQTLHNIVFLRNCRILFIKLLFQHFFPFKHLKS